MHAMAFYIFAYLAAAVLAVIVSRRLGLGSVVGYIAAGVLVGPVLNISIAGSDYLEHFSEFGIVMMLFLIGLEVDPHMVWRLRNRLLGLGGLQVSGTIAAVFLVSSILGASWQQGALLGFVAALSSTAIVLQTLEERGLTGSDGGRSSFAVLLFQDLAVIPMLACIPLLSGAGHSTTGTHSSSYIDALPAWATAMVTLSAVGVVVIAGHYLSRPIFRLIAQLGLREVFTATALLVVVGITVLMSVVGLSPALGAFLAGLVLANSEFKHELQSDLEPFKGLLLGLFFMTIGARIDFEVLSTNWAVIMAITVVLLATKFAVLLPLAWIFHVRASAGWLFALGLSQAGEFGFVILSMGRETGILTAEQTSIFVLVITVGMILTPGLFVAYDRIAGYIDRKAVKPESEHPRSGRIIVAGVGRFGQIVNRMLLANGHFPVILDFRADVVDDIRKFGIRSYFGDAGRPDLLEAAGLSNADLLIVAIDDPERATEIVAYARRTNPDLRIIARAYDRLHHYKLLSAGADHIVRELFASSLEVAGLALRELGMHPYEVEKRKMVFGEQDVAGLARMASLVDGSPVTNNADFVAGFNDIGKVIQTAMLGHRSQYDSIVQRGWSPPTSDASHTPRAKDGK